jgi:hypothetical protein
MRPSGERRRALLGLLPPAVEGGPINAEDMCDQRRALPLAPKVNATAAPPYQLKWSSNGFAHTPLYASTRRAPHYVRSSQ